MNTNASTCPICGTPVEYNDPKIVCPSCQVTFHHECWQDNKGCSTYGCKQVNVLNPPMKVDIPPSGQTGGMSRDQMLQQLVARLNRGEIDQATYQRIYAEIMSANSPPIMPTFGQPLSSPNYSAPQMNYSILQNIKFSFNGWLIWESVAQFLTLLFTVVSWSKAMSEDAMGAFSLVVLLLCIPSIVFGCMLFYRLWNITLPEVRNNISPGNATGSFFIPFYNIYWFPVGFYKLADNINQTLLRYGKNNTINVAALGSWVGGLLIFSFYVSILGAAEILIFDILGTFLSIFCFILLIFYYYSLIKAVEMILNSQQNRHF
jgi:uncharacterized Zn finger protein (UPF0148 family)